VVMEVNTGEIRALSNLSRDGKGRYREIYNYAVGSQGVREPGSTFKLASMIALLEDSDLKLTDSIETGNGEFKFHNTIMRDHEEDGFGTLTVQQVFEKSSNIGVAKMVVEHFGDNPQEYVDYLKFMGLSEPLGFQMIGEGQPYIKEPSDSSWSGLTLPWMSHGYELKISPLQTLAFYNAVANNGTLIRPIIVKHVRRADHEVETYRTTILRKQICSRETLDNVKIMLQGVVENGTARQINNEYYSIAGKTGTAQKIANGRYINKYYTSFVGYFPAENPKFSCIVVIDNPKGYYQHGSDVAAPVFKEIADRIYASDYDMHIEFESGPAQAGVYPTIRSGYRPDLELICQQLNVINMAREQDDWVKTRTSQDTIFWVGNKQYANLVPDVTGMTLKDAVYLLENKGLQVNFDGMGRVRKQSLRPGSKASRGKRIKIELS
jgi:cell division protein FtsI (penicillin-binding protein 3)